MTDPYDGGLLDVGDGRRIRWDVRGNPGGTPAVVVHGGPGSGAPTGTHRSFDPARYRTHYGSPRTSARSKSTATSSCA